MRGWLESRRIAGMSLDLKNTKTALELLGRPDKAMKCIQIAGSNGKGSACAQLAGSLIVSGKKTGMFTSPHVSRIEERIRIDGQLISPSEFDKALDEIRNTNCDLTFFEITFLAALVACKNADVEYMILETGLGGRYDATTCAEVIASLITSISLEHSEILGDSLEKIAAEKAGIARKNIPIVVKDPLKESIRRAILSEAPHAKFVTANGNAKTEAKLLAKYLLDELGLPWNDVNVRWPARMQLIEGKPSLLLDSAHNPSGMTKSVPAIEKKLGTSWILIFGSSPQQNISAFVKPLQDLIRRNPPSKIILTLPQGGRYPGTTEIPLDGEWVETPSAAFEKALTMEIETIVVTGSLYLCGNILTHIGMDRDEDLALMTQAS